MWPFKYGTGAAVIIGTFIDGPWCGKIFSFVNIGQKQVHVQNLSFKNVDFWKWTVNILVVASLCSVVCLWETSTERFLAQSQFTWYLGSINKWQVLDISGSRWKDTRQQLPKRILSTLLLFGSYQVGEENFQMHALYIPTVM